MLGIPQQLLLAVLLCFAGDSIATDELPFEIDLAVGTINGNGVGTDDPFIKQIEDIDDGSAQAISFRWRPSAAWTTEVRYVRLELSYENPLNPYCPMSAGVLTGYDYCQAGIQPREGSIEDEYESFAFLVGRSWAFGKRVSFGLALGYETVRWQSEDDLEAATLSTCISNPPESLIPGCSPIKDKAREDGLLAEAHVEWTFATLGTLRIGGHWQAVEYQVYRNNAGPRFCEQNTSPVRGFCNSLGVFLPESALDGTDSWNWWFGEIAWDVTRRWQVSLRGEAGGTRDWEIATAALRYRW